MAFEWLTSNAAQVLFVFILLFTLVFGLLQKTKLFGEGKRQIDALISLAIALLTCSVGYVLDIIPQLVSFMAVGLVIILVFIMLIGFFHVKDEKEGFKAKDWMINTAIAIAFIAVVIAVLYFTGAWESIAELWRDESSSVIGNVVTVVVVLAVLAFIFFGAEKK